MELPKYHIPDYRVVFRSANMRLSSFVKKSAKVLIPIIALLGVMNSVGTDGSFGNEDSEKSVLAVVGKSITPIFKPMGVRQENWPATVGLFTGLFAKEVIVGSLNSLYFQNTESVEDAEREFSVVNGIKEAFSTIPENLVGIGESMLDPFGMNVGEVADSEVASEDLGVDHGIFGSMKKFFGTSVAAMAYLIFVLLYVPCFVAVSASWKEIGKNLALLQAGYSTLLAWTLAVLWFQVFEGGSVFWIGVSVVSLLVGIGAVIKMFKVELAD